MSHNHIQGDFLASLLTEMSRIVIMHGCQHTVTYLHHQLENRVSYYRFEENLVSDFLSKSQSCNAWKHLKTRTEFDYQRGRTDIIAVDNDGCIFAIEAKLVRWREALHQAYRNQCFAHLSYVLLPERSATIALQYLAEFEKRNVGLCYIANGKIVIAYQPNYVEPIQPGLSKVAVDAIYARYEALH